MQSPKPVRVTLLAHAATLAMRTGRFPSPDDPLDASARRALEQLSFNPNPQNRCWTSPARRAVDTAAALGLDAAHEPLLDDADPGRWAGVSIAELTKTAPDHLAMWLGDTGAAPPGGEAPEDVVARVARWLDRQGDGPGILAITHAAVIRAAVVVALDAPPAVMRQIDVPPLSLTRLGGRPGNWRLTGHGHPLSGTL